MKTICFSVVFIILTGTCIRRVCSECSSSSGALHCKHLCPTLKYHCLVTQGNGHVDNHGCVCLPQDYCDQQFSCAPTDVSCAHNEGVRCNRNNKCECYCSQDSQCNNCSAGTLGFCVNERCVCETSDYCPHGNKFYCYKNYYCAHNESKRCDWNDRCECYCDTDTDCKNCPEKGFCVNDGCVCESQNYCPGENQFYCLYLSCPQGYTSKCNSINHCYCAYVPDTCSGHDVSKCFHLTCAAGEKKYCDGYTCTCKPLDFCKQNDADCLHKNCDASKAEVRVCVSGTCGCLSVPDFCGGDDTSTCQHLTCNQYQVKKCEMGMCKCQLNPSCKTNEGLNDTCTPENTYLEVKGTDGTTYYASCTDSYHYPLCVEDRCQCVYWKTPPPQSTLENSTSRSSSTSVAQSSFTTMHTTVPLSSTTRTSVMPTTSFKDAPCSFRTDCNQGNTHIILQTFTMPCPVDHIDCINSKCFCSLEKITTTTPPTEGYCYVCTQETSFTNCLLRTTICQSDEVCFTSKNVDEHGIIRHNSGCISQQVCKTVTGQDVHTTVGPDFLIGNLLGRKRSVSSNCFTCCYTYEGAKTPCNNHMCETTLAPPISCHQCGDKGANIPCELQTVYMGQPTQCSSGSYCMTDVIQHSDDSVSIYKRCVDELTCRNEWMAQTSDQDRCLRYAEGALPGQYSCHYCCTVDGCNSKIVPEAKYFYSTSSPINT